MKISFLKTGVVTTISLWTQNSEIIESLALNEGQISFDFGQETVPDICLEKLHSSLLWDTLERGYRETISGACFYQTRMHCLCQECYLI